MADVLATQFPLKNILGDDLRVNARNIVQFNAAIGTTPATGAIEQSDGSSVATLVPQQINGPKWQVVVTPTVTGPANLVIKDASNDNHYPCDVVPLSRVERDIGFEQRDCLTLINPNPFLAESAAAPNFSASTTLRWWLYADENGSAAEAAAGRAVAGTSYSGWIYGFEFDRIADTNSANEFRIGVWEYDGSGEDYTLIRESEDIAAQVGTGGTPVSVVLAKPLYIKPGQFWGVQLRAQTGTDVWYHIPGGAGTAIPRRTDSTPAEGGSATFTQSGVGGGAPNFRPLFAPPQIVVTGASNVAGHGSTGTANYTHYETAVTTQNADRDFAYLLQSKLSLWGGLNTSKGGTQVTQITDARLIDHKAGLVIVQMWGLNDVSGEGVPGGTWDNDFGVILGLIDDMLETGITPVVLFAFPLSSSYGSYSSYAPFTTFDLASREVIGFHRKLASVLRAKGVKWIDPSVLVGTRYSGDDYSLPWGLRDLPSWAASSDNLHLSQAATQSLADFFIRSLSAGDVYQQMGLLPHEAVTTYEIANSKNPNDYRRRSS